MTPQDTDDFADIKAVTTDETRFMEQHLFTCPDCLAAPKRCNWYRAALAEQLGADLAAYVLGEE